MVGQLDNLERGRGGAMGIMGVLVTGPVNERDWNYPIT